MVKLLLLDIDGTLRPKGQSCVPPENVQAVRAMQRRGVKVGIATGRGRANVPAALLLSGFTEDGAALLAGTNLGGLGTLIASMASLISYKQIARNAPALRGRYLRWFTAANVLFLAVLLGLYALLR